MKLAMTRNEFVVELAGWEQVLSMHPGDLRVPRDQVERAHLEVPQHRWRQLRIPGAYLPGVIQSGTYVWPGRREFWLVHRWEPGRLVVELKPFARYDRLVLGVAEPEAWADKINTWLGSEPSG